MLQQIISFVPEFPMSEKSVKDDCIRSLEHNVEYSFESSFLSQIDMKVD